MEIPELGEKTVPEMIALRVPNEMKPSLVKLMALEKRKLNNLFLLLLKEGIPIKQKVHGQKNILTDAVISSGEKLCFERRSLDHESDYKDNPGLLIEISNGVKMAPIYLMVSKENAMTLAANLSIFINEVNL